MDVLGVGCARVSFFETWPKKRYRKKMEYDLKASDLFDCFAEDDDLELKAMFGAPRLQSGMSDSSTESSLAPSPSLLSSNLTYSTSDVLSEVKAYCRFTHELVRLQFPMDTNGWQYRDDLGGTSQHRWDYCGILSMVVRHSTCKKAVVPRSLCRHCKMRDWRIKCAEPDDTFFIMCEHNVGADLATHTLRQIQIGEPIVISGAVTALYDSVQVSMFNASPRKRAIDHSEKRRRMDNLRQQQLVTSVKPSNGLADEIEKRTNNELVDMLRLTAPTAFLPLSPARVPYRPPSSFLPVYQGLLFAILYQAGYARTVSRSGLEKIMVEVRQTVRACVVPNDELGRLFIQLGVPFGVSLYVKPCVIDWLTRTCSDAEDVVTVNLGFYVAPTCQIFGMIKTDDQLPPFILHAKHGLIQNYQVALKSAKQRVGVRPVLMMVPIKSGFNGPLFDGSSMLALGSVGNCGE